MECKQTLRAVERKIRPNDLLKRRGKTQRESSHKLMKETGTKFDSKQLNEVMDLVRLNFFGCAGGIRSASGAGGGKL